MGMTNTFLLNRLQGKTYLLWCNSNDFFWNQAPCLFCYQFCIREMQLEQSVLPPTPEHVRVQTPPRYPHISIMCACPLHLLQQPCRRKTCPRNIHLDEVNFPSARDQPYCVAPSPPTGQSNTNGFHRDKQTISLCCPSSLPTHLDGKGTPLCFVCSTFSVLCRTQTRFLFQLSTHACLCQGQCLLHVFC